jgi:regulator of RNase E activity RraA
MPKREDVTPRVPDDSIDKGTALWAVLEALDPGDILVVQGYGSVQTGSVGEMLARFFQAKGGGAIVADCAIDDTAAVRALGLPVWSRESAPPRHASQADLIPWGYEVPIACGGVLVLPGDIIVADDDGAVLVPRRLAPAVIESAKDKEVTEQFARERIEAGGELQDYYPLSVKGQREFDAWISAHD